MANDEGLLIFEAAMRIAKLRVVERRPEPDGPTSYVVADRDDPTVGAWCLIRDEDSATEGWRAAAEVVREAGAVRRRATERAKEQAR